MNSDFPRILTLLRKEQGISQKKAAADLGISQALLSHYEKGIRECGLDFIVRTADYYGVSCDYLLGKTPHRQGEKLHVPETEEEDTHDGLPNVSRKIISNSLHIVFGILKKINSKSLTKEITLYLSGAVYNAFRMLYTANPKNPSALFETKDGLSEALTDGRMQLARAKSRVMLLGEKASDDEAVKTAFRRDALGGISRLGALTFCIDREYRKRTQGKLSKPTAKRRQTVCVVL